jgi:hypothetical protein
VDKNKQKKGKGKALENKSQELVPIVWEDKDIKLGPFSQMQIFVVYECSRPSLKQSASYRVVFSNAPS